MPLDQNSQDRVGLAIVALCDLLQVLREELFATSQDRRSVADAFHDAIETAKQREIAVRDAASSQMAQTDRFASKEAKENAGNSALLKDEEYISLQDNVRKQGRQLAYADALLERKKGEHETGLEMLRLLRLCAETSGVAFTGELEYRVNRLIEGAAADPPITPDPGENPAQAGAAAPVLNVILAHLADHGRMSLTDLRNVAGQNGFSEDTAKDALRGLYNENRVDYQDETTGAPEPTWILKGTLKEAS
jgi:hypothetical protein